MDLSVGMGTDVGRMRSDNEDSLYANANRERGLFIVADGMGGHAAGEVASAMAIDILSQEISIDDPLEREAPADRIADALRRANDAIYTRTLTEVDKQGMGTTVSVLFLAGDHYIIGQIGDSRVYLMREGKLRQLTTDHSYVQEQVDAGLLTPEQARVHPYSNVITRCLGASASVEPDIYEDDAQEGDIFLLASDGLTGMVEDSRLLQLLLQKASPSRVVNSLISEANARGGVDNITAVVVHLTGPGSPRVPTTGVHTAPTAV